MKNKHFFRWICLTLVMFPSLAAAALAASDTAVLQIDFPGMRNVHTDVRVADGVDGEAGGQRVARSNWKTDGTVITVPTGIYDLRMRHGAAVHVVDNVDCSAGSCSVSGLSALMTVRFPGMSSVHSRVLTAAGDKVVDSNWKRDGTEIRVFPQVYSLSARKGGATLVVDEVDCRSGSCLVDNLVASLTVPFDGLSNVHTSVYPDDGVGGSVSGNRHTRASWKSNQAVIPVFRQQFDLSVVKGASTHIVDGVDCSSGSCTVGNLSRTLTVGFDGLSSVHTKVYLDDGVTGQVSGNKVTEANWKSNQAQIRVLPGVYDLKVIKGASTQVVDSVDCSAGDCSVGELGTTLTVNFPGLSSVHTSVHIADGEPGVAGGDKVTWSNWRTDQATLPLFSGVYDVKIRRGGASWVVDDVDCSAGGCAIDDLVRTLTVDFPGLSAVHTAAHVDDGVEGTASGKRAGKANWKTDQAQLKLLPGRYDVQVRKGGGSFIIDAVDCTAADCQVSDLVRTLTVNFPGMSSVHTRAYVSDGNDSQVSGSKVGSAGWKTDFAVLTVFPGIYDLRLAKGKSSFIVDDVDCRSGNCEVNDLVRTLTVDFPGLSSVHTAVYLPDGNSGQVGEDKVSSANWRTDQAVLKLFPGSYDVQLRRGGGSFVVDNVNCSQQDCQLSELVRTLTVKFPGMSGVHSSVRVDDGELNQAEGEQVVRAGWKSEQAELSVFPGVYDVRVSKGAATYIVDAVDCSDDDCLVDGIVQTLRVTFPGLSSVHSSAHLPDGSVGSASGERVTKANWKKDAAELVVFRQLYDLQVRKGGATLVVDDVDCSGAEPCEVNDLTATLVVEFPGLRGVHTDVRVPDGVDGSASGELITRANWKSHQASVTLLRQVVDLRVRHGLTTVFDNVDCSSGSCSAVVEGNLQVSLINGDANVALPGLTIRAYEKTADGELIQVQRVSSSPTGRANFSLPGLADGAVFVLKAYNPFGNNASFFSPLITSTGPFDFIVSADGDNSLDLSPPQVAFSSPLAGSNVSVNGFTVRGSAADDRQLTSVSLRITDAAGGDVELAASLDPQTGNWTAEVPASALNALQPSQLLVIASDLALNTASATITVTPVVDDQGPEILFLSHQPQDPVQETGFLLSGSVSDLTGVTSLTVTLTDPNLGITIAAREVQVSAESGAWTVAVSNDELSSPISSDPAANIVNVRLDAQDEDANAGTASIELQLVAVDNSGLHLINRISFGATPALVNEVAELGPDGFLDQQLNPIDIDDGLFEARIAGSVPGTREELQSWTLLHMIYSRRQLLEVMTWFWENHFNTEIGTTRVNADGDDLTDTVAYELAENQAFRANALGNFGELLAISAKSPAMLIYLDSISNVASDSNENYPREVMELHSLGVDGGYTDADVAAVSELFTGWTIRDDAFFFDADNHNPAAQTVLGQSIAAGGVEQAEQFLDILARHPSTASFLCSKLVTVFVDDRPPAALVQRCAATFLATVDDPQQMVLVLDEILNSPEFFAVYRNKIKTPVELVVGALRHLDAETDATDLVSPMAAMGLRLYQNPIPTGDSEIGEDWINASLLLERMKWVNAMVRRQPAASGSYTDPLSFYPGHGVETAEGIVNFLLQLTMAGDHGDLERTQALQMLQGINGFDLGDADAEQRLRRLQGAVLSFPQYQFQ